MRGPQIREINGCIVFTHARLVARDVGGKAVSFCFRRRRRRVSRGGGASAVLLMVKVVAVVVVVDDSASFATAGGCG